MTHFITKQGLTDLQVEYDDLTKVQLPAALEQLNEARSEGDLKENAGYDAAKSKRATLEARIAEIEDVLDDNEIIKDESQRSTDKVEIGNTVEVEFMNTDNKVNMKLKIVGASEANAIKNMISNESPLAQAVLGKKPGDTVKFNANTTQREVKIINITV